MQGVHDRRRVLIDGYFLGKASGFGRFIFEICHALGRADTELDFIVAVPGNVDAVVLTPYPRITYKRLPAMIFPLWEQLALPLCAFQNRCSLIHAPYNSKPLFSRGSRTITTVHDVTFLDKHAERDWKSAIIHAYGQAVFALSVRKCPNIVSVSDTTQRALASIGVTSRRIYNSVGGFLSHSRPADVPAPTRPYFLHRGGYAAGHRNTERVIQAFLSRPELHEAYTLKILGAPDGANRWNTGPDQNIQFLKRVSDAELVSLYAQSACLVAASLLEGFCLPIIEAFGLDCPVVTSNIDPMKEIAGDAALLVDPLNVEGLAQAMLRVASDKTLADDLVRKGRTRLKEFSSERMAGDLLSLYEERLQSGSRVGRLAAQPRR